MPPVSTTPHPGLGQVTVVRSIPPASYGGDGSSVLPYLKSSRPRADALLPQQTPARVCPDARVAGCGVRGGAGGL